MNAPVIIETEKRGDIFLPIIPRDLQWEAHDATLAHIRSPIRGEPAYVYASVGFGKTILIAMLGKHAQHQAEIKNKEQFKIMVLARTGDLADQNAEKMWEMHARNSIFSASLKLKSTKYSIVVGTEGTVARSMEGQLKNFIPDILLIDECYQVDHENLDGQYMTIINEFIARKEEQGKRRGKPETLSIIGYGGSEYRGRTPILGGFWKHRIFACSMWKAIEIGYCTPILFGFGDDEEETEYSGLDDIKPSGFDGTEDLTKEQMLEQNKIITKQKTVTHNILVKVNEIGKTRNCMLITCAGKKHIDQCVEVLKEIGGYSDYLDAETITQHKYAIVTEKTKTSDRKIIKQLCNTGKIKIVFQIGAWTVGVNVPMFDVVVILRRIGSRTLLEQLTGRGIRWLEQWQKELGFIKEDCLVLDYAGTFESMAEFFDDELLEAAQLAKAKRKQEFIYCPRCLTENGSLARRCMSRDPRAQQTGKDMEPDGRCGHFWSSKICPNCQAENDKVTRSCRICDHLLVDPNAALSGRSYTDADWKPVLKFEMFLTKDKLGLVFKYTLPDDEVATEALYPKSPDANMKGRWYKFVTMHVHKAWHEKIMYRSAVTVLGQKALIDVPTDITHRINDKNKSIIHRKKFSSGRTEDAAL